MSTDGIIDMKDDNCAAVRVRLTPPRARVGVIIPTSNRMIEPQFQHYAPVDLGIHFARAQITGKWAKPIAQLTPEIARAAITLADIRPDLMVFNCTATSMKEGPEGEAHLIKIIRDATGVTVTSTAASIIEALTALRIRKLVLVTPYIQATNDHESHYLRARGFDVVRDAALGLKSGDEYITVPPTRWIEIALANDHPQADGYLLSCTNTTQIEAIEAIEQATGKPVISSNQAVLWACVDRLRPMLTSAASVGVPGRLNRLSSRADAVTG
jgi:maleate cis-trans isomerase